MLKRMEERPAPPSLLLPEGLRPEDCLFFDIETTGFSPSVSSLYLIGALFVQEGRWMFCQWFADDYESEPAILEEFGRLLSSRRTVIQYNGDHFDIPYLDYKWNQHGLSYSFAGLERIDLYRKILPCRFLFGDRSLKLRSMEEFLRIQRSDPYSGKDLITLYGTYLKSKYMQKPEQDELLAPLLLHNREDVLALPALTRLLAYPALLEGNFTVEALSDSQQELTAKGRLFRPLPQPVRARVASSSFQAEGDQFQITIPFYHGELFYFLPDYKDYYYLPLEDTAVHKSVGEFVDRKFRRKATASTCYLRKSGRFLPAPPDTEQKLFRTGYRSKDCYVLWEDFRPEEVSSFASYLLWQLSLLKGQKKKNGPTP